MFAAGGPRHAPVVVVNITSSFTRANFLPFITSYDVLSVQVVATTDRARMVPSTEFKIYLVSVRVLVAESGRRAYKVL